MQRDSRRHQSAAPSTVLYDEYFAEVSALSTAIGQPRPWKGWNGRPHSVTIPPQNPDLRPTVVAFSRAFGVTVLAAPAPPCHSPRSRPERSRLTLSRMYRMLTRPAIAALGVAAALAALSPPRCRPSVTTGAVTGVVTDESGQASRMSRFVTNRRPAIRRSADEPCRRPYLSRRSKSARSTP